MRSIPFAVSCIPCIHLLLGRPLVFLQNVFDYTVCLVSPDAPFSLDDCGNPPKQAPTEKPKTRWTTRVAYHDVAPAPQIGQRNLSGRCSRSARRRNLPIPLLHREEETLSVCLSTAETSNHQITKRELCHVLLFF